MTQNTEQNVRTGDGLVTVSLKLSEAAKVAAKADLGLDISQEQFSGLLWLAGCHPIDARGAEEQRRKDAEERWQPIETAPKDGTCILVPMKHIGADVVLWSLNGWRETSNMLLMREQPTHWMPIPSFPSDGRPANVAALEARVKVLEAEKIHEFNSGYVIACCNTSNLHNEPTIACDVLAELDISEDDIQRMDLAEYDATALAEIRKQRKEDPVRAALTREGGV